jgi:L-threonylcarbamoyladenylate synthase
LHPVLFNFNTQIGTETAQAGHWLRAGETVGIPTETVYGLAANALHPAAVARIFEVKNRPSFDPLIVHVASVEAAEAYVSDFPGPLRRLAETFWPGPLTLLLPKREIIPDLVTSGLPQVGIRMPAHPLTRALLQSLPFPLAAPSANPFGYISPTTAQHVMDQLGGKIPYILDGGPCLVGVESTIAGMEGEQVVVYRLGGLALEQLEAVAGPLQLHLNQSSNPTAPGMLKSHYAPRKPLYILDKNTDIDQYPADAAWLLFGPAPAPAHRISYNLSEKADLAEAAQYLFAALRHLDQSAAPCILARWLPDLGLGRAINDRLRRAGTNDE